MKVLHTHHQKKIFIATSDKIPITRNNLYCFKVAKHESCGIFSVSRHLERSSTQSVVHNEKPDRNYRFVCCSGYQDNTMLTVCLFDKASVLLLFQGHFVYLT